MTKLQKVIGLAAALMLMVGLSACSVPPKGSGDISEFTVTLSDKTVVPCFKINGYHGYVCNFDKAVRATNTPTP